MAKRKAIDDALVPEVQMENSLSNEDFDALPNPTGITDKELVETPIRDLNLRLKDVPLAERTYLKNRRRALKNRGYASITREKISGTKEQLEAQRERLQKEVDDLRNTNKRLREQLKEMMRRKQLLQQAAKDDRKITVVKTE